MIGIGSTKLVYYRVGHENDWWGLEERKESKGLKIA